jgi:cysteine desulfuration protein SufE
MGKEKSIGNRLKNRRMSIKEREQKYLDDLEMFDTWDDKYDYIMSLGSELPEIPGERKNEETRVYGCQSASWLEARMQDGKLYYKGDSEAILGKGVISMLLNIVNGATPGEILNYDFYIVDKIKLKEHLSPVRRHGLESVMKRIKEIAKNYADGK